MSAPIQGPIRLRRGTAAQWSTANPILKDGEEGHETDTGKRKVGNGVATWADLAYFSGGSSGFTHTQTSPATTWTINHGLGRTPAVVTAATADGSVLLGALSHPSADQSVLTFSGPQSGKARAL